MHNCCPSHDVTPFENRVLIDRLTDRHNALAGEVSDLDVSTNRRLLVVEEKASHCDGTCADKFRRLHFDIHHESHERRADVASVRKRIDNEKLERTNADTTLANAVRNETNERKNADIALSGRIDNEVAAREATDGLVQKEVNDRTNAVRSVNGRVDEVVTAQGVLRTEIADVRSDLSIRIEREEAERANGDNVLSAKIDDAKTELVAADDAERQARVEADNAERSERTLADNALSVRLDAEVSRREATDTRLTAEVEKRESDVAELQGAIDEEKAKRTSEDVRILNEAKTYTDTAMTKVFVYKGQVEREADLLSIVEKKIGDTYNVIENGANFAWNGTAWDKLSETIDLRPYALKTKLAEEAEAREAADAELGRRISAEEAARISGDATLQGNIEAEATIRATAVTEEAGKRKEADNALDAKMVADKSELLDAIGAEETARENAVTNEKNERVTAVTNEKNERMTADAALSDRIDATNETILTKEGDLKRLIEAEAQLRTDNDTLEVNARENADAALRTAIETEKSERQAADEAEVGARDSAIAVETNRATEAEGVLQTNIDNETVLREAAVETAQSNAIAAAKSYTDTRYMEMKAYVDEKWRDALGVKAFHDRLVAVENFMQAIFPEHAADSAQTLVMKKGDGKYAVRIELVETATGVEPKVEVTPYLA